MGSNVYGIGGHLSHRSGIPCEGTIQALEDMVERARSGELQGIAAALLNSDNSAEYRLAGMVGSFEMLGALECAKGVLVNINTGLIE